MDSHQQRYQTSRSRGIVDRPLLSSEARGAASAPSKTLSTIPHPQPRPLSDIRELSEPSVVDPILNRSTTQTKRRFSGPRASSPSPGGSLCVKNSTPRLQARSKLGHVPAQPIYDSSSSYSTTPEPLSLYNVPRSNVPRRSSSQGRTRRPSEQDVRNPSLRFAVLHAPREPRAEAFTVPNRGHSKSPVKETASRLDAVRSDENRRAPSHTYIRKPIPIDILQFPVLRYPRIKLDLRTTAPLFVGGGSVEGVVIFTVDQNIHARHRRSLAISALNVDLLGFEDVSGCRKTPFFAVATELLDLGHPPPADMTGPANPLAREERFWPLVPCMCTLPFLLSLPLDTGPPPFSSKHASIRFLLAATALIRDAGKLFEVRSSEDISVVPTYDPEKALTSLPSPLNAKDTLSLARLGRCETLVLTAGIHRQVWVSGSSAFVDIHIANKTHKAVNRLELSLERSVLLYRHPPAKTREKMAREARIFEKNERSTITRESFKTGTNSIGTGSFWHGVAPHQSETRTYELELPRGHATVRCGEYLEVRFFINISASLSTTKGVAVQLPIVLIHINSVDALPNCINQVAAAIEEKRRDHEHRGTSTRMRERVHTRSRSTSSPGEEAKLYRKPSYAAGRAFAAPRQQSLDRQRTQEADINDLRQVLDHSPRKHFSLARNNVPSRKKSRRGQHRGAINDSRAVLSPITNMSYRTPLSRRDEYGHARAENPPTLQLRHVHSLDSPLHSKLASPPDTPLPPGSDYSKPFPGPMCEFTIVQHSLKPHASPIVRSPTRHGTSADLPRHPLQTTDGVETRFLRKKGTTGSLRERGKAWLLDRVLHRGHGSGGGGGGGEDEIEPGAGIDGRQGGSLEVSAQQDMGGWI